MKLQSFFVPAVHEYEVGLLLRGCTGE